MWSPPAPPAASLVDTVATVPNPQTYTLVDVVTQLVGLRNEVADALWRVMPGVPDVVQSLQFVASLQVKFGPGVLYGLDGFNNSGSTRTIQFFDARDLPADGALPYGPIINVATVSNFNRDFGFRGLRFQNALWIVSSSTTNTKTITGTADMWVAARYL